MTQRAFLIAASTSALLVITSAAAQPFGGSVVYDPTQSFNMGKQIANLAQQLGIQSESLDQLVSILNTGTQTLSQIQQLYSLTQRVENDVAHLTHANSLAALLFQLQNSMETTGLMPVALTGNGRFGNQAGPWATQFYNQNVVYIPQGAGWATRRIGIDAQALANAQGQGAANLQNLEMRASGLANLQSCIDNSATLQDATACNSRISAELAYAQNQTAQATNLAILQSAQRDAAAQAQSQASRQYLDSATADLCNAAGSTGSSNVSTLCVSTGNSPGLPDNSPSEVAAND